jgi:hypothetical protein
MSMGIMLGWTGEIHQRALRPIRRGVRGCTIAGGRRDTANGNVNAGNKRQRFGGKAVSEIIRDITGYVTSKDYGLLFLMAKVQSIVCICDHDYYGRPQRPPCRDIAQTISDGSAVNICARGTCYADGDTAEEFVRQCKAANVEWIVPTA